MTAFDWAQVRQHFHALKSALQPRRRPRAAAIGLESLEPIELLSRTLLGHIPANIGTTANPSIRIHTVSASTQPQQVEMQTAAVPSTLTNFQLPFTPSFNLFDPKLGTLTAVHITGSASLSSNIKSQNQSRNSGADITAMIQGTYSVTGFPVALNGSLPDFSQTKTVPPYNGEAEFEGPSTAIFNALSTSSTVAQTLTDPTSLAYFTSTAGRTTATPQLAMNANANANAPNGNLDTFVMTSGTGTLTVSYTYTPRTPAVVNLVRFGIHHQQTVLRLTFAGPVTPAEATNPNNYRVIVPNRHGSFTGPGVTYIAVTSATFDPATNTVSLVPARQLNVHYKFQLQVKLPINNGNIVILDFGGKSNLGGYLNHQGKFITTPLP